MIHMGNVYIIQNQQRMNERTGALEAKFDLTSAEKFGQTVHLLSPTARPFSSEHVIGVLREKLASFGDDDHLLLIGNPCLIGFAVAIAADFNDGRVKVLQWSGTNREYISVSADLQFMSH
jgi:hypothetical protein